MPTELESKRSDLTRWIYSEHFGAENMSNLNALHRTALQLMKKKRQTAPHGWIPVDQVARQLGCNRGNLVRRCRQEWLHQGKAEMFTFESRITWHLKANFVDEQLRSRGPGAPLG